MSRRRTDACCESGPKTVFRQTSAKRRKLRSCSVERPSPRLPPAVAHRQLTPGTASTARTKTLSQVAGSGPDLANGLGSKFAHRVAVRASRRAPATTPFFTKRRVGSSSVKVICRHPSPGGAVVDAGVGTPRHRPGGRRSSSRTRGVGPDCHSSATGRGGQRTLFFSPDKGEKKNVPPRRFRGKRNDGKRQPAPVTGDFCALTKREKKNDSLEKRKGRRLRRKKGNSRPSALARTPHSLFLFSPSRRRLFFFPGSFFLLSSQLPQVADRGEKAVGKNGQSCAL